MAGRDERMTDPSDAVLGYGNPQYDQSAKRILAFREIEARILKRVASEFRDVSVRDIAEHYIEGPTEISGLPVMPDETNAGKYVRRGHKKGSEHIRGRQNESVSPTEGVVTFDILFHARVPGLKKTIKLIVNIEAQKTQKHGKLGYAILRRAVYYAARLISSQKETEFTGSDYDGVQKVYVVFICMDSPTRQSAINRYSLTEKHLLHRYQEDVENYDLISIVMIYLAGDKTRDRLIQMLNLIFKDDKKSAEEKKDILKTRFDFDMTPTLEEELRTMCNLSEGVYERAMEAGLQEGRQQGLRQGMEQGMEQGLEQGLERGMQQGVVQNRIANIKSLMQNLKLSAKDAMDVLSIPQDVRNELLQEL